MTAILIGTLEDLLTKFELWAGRCLLLLAKTACTYYNTRTQIGTCGVISKHSSDEHRMQMEQLNISISYMTIELK
jgi:hypothetical protein